MHPYTISVKGKNQFNWSIFLKQKFHQLTSTLSLHPYSDQYHYRCFNKEFWRYFILQHTIPLFHQSSESNNYTFIIPVVVETWYWGDRQILCLKAFESETGSALWIAWLAGVDKLSATMQGTGYKHLYHSFCVNLTCSEQIFMDCWMAWALIDCCSFVWIVY